MRPRETPCELYTRLKDLFQKWIRPSGKMVEEISELLILEQFLRTLAPVVQVWVKERNPRNGQGACIPEFCREALTRPTGCERSEGFGYGGGSKTTEPRRMPVHTTAPAKPWSDLERRPEGPIVCYYCKQEDHINVECPDRKPKYSTHSCIPKPGEGRAGFMGRLQTMPVMVNGKRSVALLVQVARKILVQPHQVEECDYIQGRSLKVLYVNGDEHEYPMVEIRLDIQDQTYQVVGP